MTGGHEIFHDWGHLIVHLTLCKGAGAPAISVEAAVREPRPEQNPHIPADGAKLPPPSESSLTSEITFFLPCSLWRSLLFGFGGEFPLGSASKPWSVLARAWFGKDWRPFPLWLRDRHCVSAFHCARACENWSFWRKQL